MYNDFNYERFINSEELRNTTQYVVKQGDSIYTIAKKHNVSVNDLIALNRLSSTMIYPNQVIFIPTQGTAMPNVQHHTQQNVQHHAQQQTQPLQQNQQATQPMTVQGDTIRSLRQRHGNRYDLEVLRVEPNQRLVLRTQMTREVVVTEDMNLQNTLENSNLTADEFLRLNENNIFKTGNKIVT